MSVGDWNGSGEANLGEDLSTLIERARKWGEERDQLWLEEGMKRGIRWGIEQECRLVRRLVERRFGAATAERVAPLLEGLPLPEDMEAIADAVIECPTAEEFLRRVLEG